MAHEASVFDTWKRPSHDGALRCVLCAVSRPGVEHEWCIAAESLVCDDCCAALLHGDVMRLFSVAANAGRIVTLETLCQACSHCQRACRHAEEHLLEDAGGGNSPAC